MHVGTESMAYMYLINEVSNNALDFINVNLCFSQELQGSFKRLQWQLVGPQKKIPNGRDKEGRRKDSIRSDNNSTETI